MGLVPAGQTHYDRAHSIKKKPLSGDSRKSGAILSQSQYVGIVQMVFVNSVREADPRVARAEVRRAACVRYDTQEPSRLVCGSCKPCGKAR